MNKYHLSEYVVSSDRMLHWYGDLTRPILWVGTIEYEFSDNTYSVGPFFMSREYFEITQN